MVVGLSAKRHQVNTRGNLSLETKIEERLGWKTNEDLTLRYMGRTISDKMCKCWKRVNFLAKPCFRSAVNLFSQVLFWKHCSLHLSQNAFRREAMRHSNNWKSLGILGSSKKTDEQVWEWVQMNSRWPDTHRILPFPKSFWNSPSLHSP